MNGTAAARNLSQVLERWYRDKGEKRKATSCSGWRSSGSTSNSAKMPCRVVVKGGTSILTTVVFERHAQAGSADIDANQVDLGHVDMVTN